MSKSAARGAMRAGWPAVLLIGLACAAAALLAATPTWASSPSNASLKFYKEDPGGEPKRRPRSRRATGSATM